MHELVRTAELGLWPAEYESFGISVVETMAAGLVPVLNDIRAFRYFHDAGDGARNGGLVDFKNAAAAAEVIRATRRSVNADTSHRAREVAQRYGWEKVVVEVEDIYRTVIADAAR